MKNYILPFLLFLPQLVLCQTEIDLPLNQCRFLASHNSYKKVPQPKVLKFLYKFKKQLGASNDPEQIDYGHELLSVQLDSFNVQGFELDVNYDPKGGLYRKRTVSRFVCGVKAKDKAPEMKEPSFKILHIADVDFETNYKTLRQALQELKKWSDLHPNHLPVFVNIEAKGDHPGNVSKFLRFIGFKRAISFNRAAFDALDKEILEEMGNAKIFSPIDLKGNYNSVKERIQKEGWPLLSACRGKFFFILEGDNQENYLDDKLPHPLFVYDNPNLETTAFVKRNDPEGNETEIQALTALFMVRTRSDAGTIEARNNDYRRFQAAWKSGAQIISTDYYKADKRIGNFRIQLPKN